MRVVIQKVKKASVIINQGESRSIEEGLLVFVGIEDDDNEEDAEWLANKISNLRIFDDSEGVMNLSVNEINGSALVISQFTLHAKTKKGNRPSYIKAANPLIAIPIYDHFCQLMNQNIKGDVMTGEFGAHMEVELINNGPVTILIDTKSKE